MKNHIFNVLIVLFTLLSCTSNDENTIPCELSTFINSEQFKSAPSDHLTINNLEINKNCLKINFSSSGCSGDTWEIKLIDSGEILESQPPQRNLRLSLKNEEACDAYLTKELTFDISQLKIMDGSNSVLLNIINSDQQILYSY